MLLFLLTPESTISPASCSATSEATYFKVEYLSALESPASNIYPAISVEYNFIRLPMLDGSRVGVERRSELNARQPIFKERRVFS
jgi:hypothetical protein